MPSSKPLRVGGVLLLLLLVFSILVPSQPAYAKNSVHVDNKKKVITITVNVTMIGKAEKAAFLQTAFDGYWGKSGYRYRCYDVVLKAKVTPSKTKKAGEHTVFVFPSEPTDVATVSKPRNYDPTKDSGVGHWSDWDDANVVAHEFGHFFGLGDEYTYHDKNNNKRRDFDERSIPDPAKALEYTWNDEDNNKKIDPGEVSLKPGEAPSLMAEWADTKSKVLQRHIDEIVKKHAPRGSIDCKWRGTLEQTTTGTTATAGASGTTVVTYQMELMLDEDEHGVLTGTADATFALRADFSLECGTTTTRMEPVSGELSVTGHRDDEIMQLEITADGPIEGMLDTTGAGGCGSYTMPHDFGADITSQSGAGWPSPLSRDGSVYRLDETQSPAPGVEYTLTVVIEPVTDEGVPVG